MPETLVKKNATIADTIALIITRIDHDSKTEFVKMLARELGDPSNIPAYTKRLFDFVCRNIHYQLDKLGKEDVYKPSRTITDGIGDCKKMTVLIGSVLKAAGIEPFIKHVIYHDAEYTHVYIIVPRNGGYITVDPVNDKKFNKEVSYAHSQTFDTKGNRMDLYTGAKNTTPLKHKFIDAVNMGASSVFDDLSTISCNRTMSGTDQNTIIDSLFSEETIGKRKKKTKEEKAANKKKRQEKRQKVADKFKGVGLALPRGAFLAMLKINVLGFASKCAILLSKKPGILETFWNKVGGDSVALKKAVLEGANKKRIGTGQTVAAIIATATPIIAGVFKLLRDYNIVHEDSDEGDAIEETLEAAEDDIADEKIKPEDHKDLVDISKVPSVGPKITTPKSGPGPDASPTPSLGSFLSPAGLCFKGIFMLMQIQPSLTGILFQLSSLVGTYFFVGIFLCFFLETRYEKYVMPYFEVPANIFYSIFSLKNLNKIFSLKLKTHEA